MCDKEMETAHAAYCRVARIEKIASILGDGIALDMFEVDRGHKNGPELHVIDSVGVISVYNLRTRLLVTKLIARPLQIMRYYEHEGKPFPSWMPVITEMAYEHELQHLNDM